MKLTIARDALAALTGWAAATASTGQSGPLAPVLAGIMLTAANGTLTAGRFGYDASAAARAACEIGEPGRVLVPARILTDVVNALPARQPVTLASDAARLTITAGPATCTLLTMPPEDYPDLPEPATPAAEFDARDLAAAVTTAGKAAGKDDTLPALTCIRLTLDGTGTATFASTDRYRLTVVTCPYTPGPADPPGPALIPARDLAAVTRRTGTGTVHLALTEGTATLTTGDRHATIRLLSAEFPDFAPHITPAGPSATITASIPALSSAIKRAAVVADRGTAVRLGFTPGEMLIESGTADEASLAETMPVTLDGDPPGIAFNPAYLLDALAAIADTGSPAARITITSPAKPAVITPETRAGTVGCTHVLMPIRPAL